MDASFNVPTREVPPIGARKSTGAETADGRSLPVAIVNVTAVESRLFRARMIERSANGTFPGSVGDVISGAGGKGNEKDQSKYEAGTCPSHKHESSSTAP